MTLAGDIATGQAKDEVEDGKDDAAVEFGRHGGLTSGMPLPERPQIYGGGILSRSQDRRLFINFVTVP